MPRFVDDREKRAAIAVAVLVVMLTASAIVMWLPVLPAPADRPAERSLDAAVFRALNTGTANPIFDRLMPFLTDFKRWQVFALAVWLALAILGGPRGRWAALLLVPLVAASDQLTSSIIKPLVMRVRPCEVLGSVHFWVSGDGWIVTPAEAVGGFKTSFGFPSGHASNFAAAMLFFGLAYRRWKPWVPYVLLAFAGLVGLSRIYVGVHWPSDVLGGGAIGLVLGWLAYVALSRLLAWRAACRKAGTALGP